MMETLDLGGAWRLRRADRKQAIAAAVPGCVHDALQAAGKIPDPYYRENEKELQWIGESDWVYSRTFTVAKKVLSKRRIVLHCEGLDTFATVRINGRKVGSADNQFREWEFNVKRALKPGRNEIEIVFESVVPFIKRRLAKRMIPNWFHIEGTVWGSNYVRKSPCNFGWDWGPTLLTCGVWRPIRIVAFDDARLTDMQVLQEHGPGKAVTLEVRAEAETSGKEGFGGLVIVEHEGEIVAQQPLDFGKGTAAGAYIKIPNAKRWWPNGMGDQPLYRVRVELTDAGGALLDAQDRRVGLRRIDLMRKKDKWGESFTFACNGKPLFAKGANWIPADTFVTRVTREDYRRLIGDAAAAHMNMLRVWGGGVYEQPDFYEACDEMGILIWQDFMFSCATYPTFDKDWFANVEQEARQNIRRLRHHACLALWCGNNEMEQGLVGEQWTEHCMSWKDYKPLFDGLLPELTAELDPQTPYWPSSPHTPVGDRYDFNNFESGDMHFWEVWHRSRPFEWYRWQTPRFCSEFGFQSFPSPQTVEGYTLPEDRNITSPVMESHQRHPSGNAKIMEYMLSWYRLPTGMEQTIWLSQILQGMAIKYAVEHWRRLQPQTMGALYWQLNDCWPVASWASIDWTGRWKALHYMAARFFAPLLISGVEDIEKGRVTVHVTNDTLAAKQVEARWIVTTAAGAAVSKGGTKLRAAAGKNRQVAVVDCSKAIAKHGKRDLIVWLELREGGEVVSHNTVTFARPKHLALAAEPRLGLSVKKGREPGVFSAEIVARDCALYAWLTLAGSGPEFWVSDNFFDLRAGEKIEVDIHAPNRSLGELKKGLVLRSLADTHRVAD